MQNAFAVSERFPSPPTPITPSPQMIHYSPLHPDPLSRTHPPTPLITPSTQATSLNPTLRCHYPSRPPTRSATHRIHTQPRHRPTYTHTPVVTILSLPDPRMSSHSQGDLHVGRPRPLMRRSLLANSHLFLGQPWWATGAGLMAVGRYAGLGWGVNRRSNFAQGALGRAVLGRVGDWMWPASKCFITLRRNHDL